MHRYYAYGLNIDSVLPLPELPSGKALEVAPEITISLGRVEPHPQHLDETGHGFWMRKNQACYYLREVGAFLVSEGRHILVEPSPGVAQEALRLAILGPSLALVLHQRGLFILHASAIAINGAAVAFMASHGGGKSTMAAVLRARGYTVVSDDVAAVNLDDNTVVPSFPQLKLWPSVLSTLGMLPEDLPQVHPAVEKRAFRFAEGFPDCSLPLQRLYVLAIGQPTAVEVLRPRQVFEEIMRHWYGVRFGPALFDSLDLREHFLRASRLTRMVPVRRLQRPATLFEDPNLPQAIEKAILHDIRMFVNVT